MSPRWLEFATWAMPIGFALGGVFIGMLVSRVVLTQAAKLAARSSWKYDDVLVASLKGPVVLWFALLGIRIAARLLPLTPAADRNIDVILLILAVLSVCWAAARFVSGILRTMATAGTLSSVSLLANAVRIVIFLVGALVVLQTLGISITSVITAFGVAGLAVGLALQDTLANFFSGIRILAAGKVRPGDFVLLESGQEGFVEDITWGQTTIRQGAANLVIVPNAKLAQAVTTNFTLPYPPQVVTVNAGVAYGSDLERVERVALEVAREVQQTVPEAVPEFEPAFRYRQFGSSSVDFFVVLQAQNYPDRWQVVSAFIKRLHARFAGEKIEIPFPVQTVLLKPAAPPAPDTPAG